MKSSLATSAISVGCSSIFITLICLCPILQPVAFASPSTISASTTLLLDDDQHEKAVAAPDPGRALREAMSRFDAHSRKSGYEMECLAKGGLSRTGDHEVWMHQVYEDHRGQVRGDLMFVEELEVYRNPKKGAIRVAKNWIPLRDSPAGNRFDRIIHFPSRLLLTAATRARKVEWIEPAVVIDLNDPDYVDPMDPLEDPKGGTAVVEEQKKITSYERIKVEVDEKMAVEYFNGIQNSGLLGGFS